MSTGDSWFENIDHGLLDNLKRQKTALTKELAPLTINKLEKSATFQGEYMVYITTLSKCECKYFCILRKPCKHIYRLAQELGVHDATANAKNYNRNCEESWELRQNRRENKPTQPTAEPPTITDSMAQRTPLFQYLELGFVFIKEIISLISAISFGIVFLVLMVLVLQVIWRI